MPFETEPVHIEAVRELRALADHIEAAGFCRAFVVGVDVTADDDGDAEVRFGGEAGRISGISRWVDSRMADATLIDSDTDFDALDAVAV